MADEIVAVYRAEVEQYKKAVDELTGKVDNLTAAEKRAGDTGKDAMKGVASTASAVSPEVGRLTQAFNALKGGIGSVINGMRTLKGAVISTGIGALVVAVISLVQAFRASEEGQNKFQKVLAKTGVVVNNILDIFAALGEKMIEAFEKPEQAWEDFKESLKTGADLIKRQVVDRLAATFTLMGNDLVSKFIEMRVAWNEFTGDADEANALRARLADIADSSAKARDEINGLNAEIADGYRKAKAALGEFMDENKREMALAAKVADMRAKANKIERALIVERAKLESDIAELRLKARQDEEFSAKERIEFMKEAQRLQDVLLEKESEMLSLRRDAIQLENTFARSNKEALDNEAQAIAAVSQMEAARYTQKRATERELARIRRQELAELAAIAKMRADIEKEILKIATDVNKEIIKSSEELRDNVIANARTTADERKAAFVNALSEQIISHEKFAENVANVDEAYRVTAENAEKEHQDRILAINKEQYERLKAIRDQDAEDARAAREKAIHEFQQYAQVAIQAIGLISQAQAQASQYELQVLEEQLRRGSITRAEYDAERKRIMQQQAEDAKNVAIFQGVINGIVAVINAFRDGGPVLAAITAGLVAAQVAIIAAEPVPQFAKGVIGLQGAGTETSDSIPAYLSRGESVMTAAETRKHRDILEGIRKGTLDRIIHESYVKPAVDAALLNGFADIGTSAALNGLGGFNDMNILRALDRHGFAEVGELREMNVLLKRHLKAPKRGYA